MEKIEIQSFSDATPSTRFLAGYIEAALWSSTDDNDEPLDRFGSEDIDSETYAKMVTDCAAFQLANDEALATYYETVQRVTVDSVEEYAGHDFWLSRNGHGAGFFDRDGVPQETRDSLQNAAEKFGEVYLFVENGEVYAD